MVSPNFIAWIACSDQYKMPTSSIEDIKNYVSNELPGYAFRWALNEQGNSLDDQQIELMNKLHEKFTFEELQRLAIWIDNQ